MLPWVSLFVVGVCVCLHVVYREVDTRTLPALLQRFRPSADSLCFSGGAVQRKEWWVFFTATLVHADRAHLINNIAMTMVVAPTLEAVVGPATTAAVFFGAGACGWLVTYLYTRVRFASAWSIGVAQFNTSLGASPATYGLHTFAVLALPWKAPLHPALGVSSWFWVASTIVLYFFCTKRYGVDLFSGRTGAPLSTPTLVLRMALLVAGYGACYVALNTLGPLTASAWTLVYVFRVFLMKLWRLRTQQVGLSDNSCHLGGAFGGVVLGYLGQGLGFIQAGTPTSQYQHWTVWLCIVYLGVVLIAEV